MEPFVKRWLRISVILFEIISVGQISGILISIVDTKIRRFFVKCVLSNFAKFPIARFKNIDNFLVCDPPF